jgi:acyl-CoA thioester hydrolase
MEIPSPIVSRGLKVLPEWIDENGHMNVAPYLKCFDDMFYEIYRVLGVEYAEAVRRGYSQFIVQVNLAYFKEMALNESFSIEAQLINHDKKRMHWFMQMRKDSGDIAATGEFMALFMDLGQRKVSAMPGEWHDRLLEIKRHHAALGTPPGLNRRLSIPEH